MKIQLFDHGVRLWLSANDTCRWAHRPGQYWTCSELLGKRLFVEFDRGGLADLAVNGRSGDCSNNELSAIVSDHLGGKLPAGHPCKIYLEEQP